MQLQKKSRQAVRHLNEPRTKHIRLEQFNPVMSKHVHLVAASFTMEQPTHVTITTVRTK
jgi:hypothetical protein